MGTIRKFLQKLNNLLPDRLKTGLRMALPQAVIKGIWRLAYATRRKKKRGEGDGPQLSVHYARRALRLEEKLWGGFSQYAVADLEALRVALDATPAEAVHAARILGRFYAAKEEYELALDRLALVRTAGPRMGAEKHIRLLEVHCLIALGRTEDARFLLEKAFEFGNPNNPDACVLMADTFLAEHLSGNLDIRAANYEWLHWINRPFIHAGFIPLALKDIDKPPSLDNLTVAEPPVVPEDMPEKVSVLMAAFNARDYIATAMQGILDQSWRNLELIVVDDCSTDDTLDAIKAVAARDDRVIVVQQQTNGGAYVARNTALGRASGDLVVVNDSDDWAHPQKIQAQVEAQRESPDNSANLSFRLRVGPDMRVQPRLDSPHIPVVHNDYSALMLPRDAIIEMGGWDPVRFSADAEFVERLRAATGSASIDKIYNTVPLSISLFDGNNLTASSATSIWTNRFGSRKEYMASAQLWHRDQHSTFSRTSQVEPFPVPSICYHKKGHTTQLDVLIVSDFRLPGGTTHCNIEYIRALRRMGKTVGILSWPRYDISYAHSRNKKIAEVIQQEQVIPVVHGDRVEVDLVLIHHPPVMMWELEEVPDITARNVALLANQSPQRIHGGSNEMYEPATVESRVQQVFGQLPVWIPISPLIRRLLADDGGATKLSDQDWLPIIDVDAWRRPPNWRGDEREQPRIGRHSRDQWTKWPGGAKDIAAAYCANTSIDVEFLGGATTAIEKLEQTPENWTVHEFDSVPSQDFVVELDIFVHLIHEDSVEAFGRNIAEAMAAGLPVICSPSFRECFGDAALYADPTEVQRVILSLWSDKDKYIKQALAGQAFIDKHCRPDQLPDRFDEILIHNNLAKSGSS